jgi:hypothetical protein
VTQIDSETKVKPKLLFPGLESFYAIAVPLAWPIVRFAVGWNLLVHGWGKVTRGPSAYVRGFVEQGFDPALPWIWAALIIEFVVASQSSSACSRGSLPRRPRWRCWSSRSSIGRQDFRGSIAATSTPCCGASSASPSRCGAGDPTRSIAASAANSE